MSQEVRNKIYGVAGALIVVAGAFGYLNTEQQAEASTLIGQILGLIAAVLAFIKSLPSKTTTVDVPKNEVVSVLKTDGTQKVII